MAEQFLDDAQVGTTVQQVRRERVTQRMGRDADRQTRATAQTIQPIAEAAYPKRATQVIQEDLYGRRLADSGSIEQDRPAVLQVGGQGLARRPSEQTDPFLAAFAKDADLAATQVQGAKFGRGQLTDAEARGIRGLDDRPVSQYEGRPEGISVRITAGREVKIGLDGGQQSVHLLHLEDARKAAREAWRGDGAPWIAGRKVTPCGPAVKRAYGGEPLRD